MLIDQFNLFLKDASRYPAQFWSFKYYLARKSFISQVEEIETNLHPETSTKKTLSSLVKVLKEEELNEHKLAQYLSALSKIFLMSKKRDEKLEIFEALVYKFLQRSKLFNILEKKRVALKESLSEKEERKLDIHLFERAGIPYCLEYYLAVYKELENKKNREDKEKFIRSLEINLGSGTVPSLVKDVDQDESLIKFVLLILNDKIREELIRTYYRFKVKLEEFDYVDNIEIVFKQYIFSLLTMCDRLGIKELPSTFFKPYGEKPLIGDILPLFESHDK